MELLLSMVATKDTERRTGSPRGGLADLARAWSSSQAPTAPLRDAGRAETESSASRPASVNLRVHGRPFD